MRAMVALMMAALMAVLTLSHGTIGESAPHSFSVERTHVHDEAPGDREGRDTDAIHVAHVHCMADLADPQTLPPPRVPCDAARHARRAAPSLMAWATARRSSRPPPDPRPLGAPVVARQLVTIRSLFPCLSPCAPPSWRWRWRPRSRLSGRR